MAHQTSSQGYKADPSMPTPAAGVAYTGAHTTSTKTWNEPENWTANADGLVIMVVQPGMTLKYDSLGRWEIMYTTDTRVTSMHYWYGFDGYNSNGSYISGLTLFHTWHYNYKGSTLNQYAGQSKELKDNLSKIASWGRRGEGTFER